MTIISGLILNILFTINACAIEFRNENDSTPGYTWKTLRPEDVFNNDSTSQEGTEITPQTQICEINKEEAAYENTQNSSISIHTDRLRSDDALHRDILSDTLKNPSPSQKPSKMYDFPQAGSNSINRKHCLTITTITTHWSAAIRLDADTSPRSNS